MTIEAVDRNDTALNFENVNDCSGSVRTLPRGSLQETVP